MGLKPTIGDWPVLDLKALPLKERAAAAHVQVSLHYLFFHARDFAAALALFDEKHVQEARAAVTGKTNWGTQHKYIAARDGAMTLYHFGKTADDIGPNLKKSPTLWALVDHRQLKTARKLMRQLFPDFVEIRHSVGHSAELRNEREKHQVKGPFEASPAFIVGDSTVPVTIRNHLLGRSFRNTFNGKLRAYEMSADTLKGLESVKDGFYQAFGQRGALP